MIGKAGIYTPGLATRRLINPRNRLKAVLCAKRDKPLGFPFFILIHLVINTNKQHRKEDYAYKIKFNPVSAFVQQDHHKRREYQYNPYHFKRHADKAVPVWMLDQTHNAWRNKPV
jgi:hypothetical protein